VAVAVVDTAEVVFGIIAISTTGSMRVFVVTVCGKLWLARRGSVKSMISGVVNASFAAERTSIGGTEGVLSCAVDVLASMVTVDGLNWRVASFIVVGVATSDEEEEDFLCVCFFLLLDVGLLLLAPLLVIVAVVWLLL